MTDTQIIKNLLLESGFSDVKIIAKNDFPNISHRLHNWLEAGYHGELGWLINNAEKRAKADVFSTPSNWHSTKFRVEAGMPKIGIVAVVWRREIIPPIPALEVASFAASCITFADPGVRPILATLSISSTEGYNFGASFGGKMTNCPFFCRTLPTGSLYRLLYCR